MRTSLVVLGLALCVPFAGCTGSVGDSLSQPGDNDDAPGSPGGGNRPGTGGRNGGGAGSGGDTDNRVESVVAGSRFARLSHKQWENSVRDLLYLPAAPGLSRGFVGDSASGRFDNASGALQVTDVLFADYQQAAEGLATRVFTDSALRAKLIPGDLPIAPAERARAFVERFGKRAFRRPLKTSEIEAYAALFAKGPELFGQTDATLAGARVVVEAMLQSPHFLYRVETQSDAATASGKVPLSGYELASRISYALANTMPDSDLFAAADEGRLAGADDKVRAEVRAQAARLLSGPGGKEAIADFHSQLLRLYTYDGIEKDSAKVPGFVAGIGNDMRQETLAFVAEVVGNQGGVSELLTAPFTFVNQRLAPIYGVQGSFSNELKKVDLDPNQRAGLLTQSGFLAANAYRDQIDSIHRGVFVHLNVLCTDLPPPAADVPPLPEEGGKTNRERVTLHTGKGTCGGACHAQIINPAGFAFEKYDPIGKYRTLENGETIDDSGELDIGDPVMTWKTGVQFVKQVAAHPATHRCMTRAWLEYLYGRRPVDADDVAIDKTAALSLSQNKPVTELVMDIVTRDSFLYRPAL